MKLPRFVFGPRLQGTQELIDVLHAAHTPDPDDAFAWWALVTGKVEIPGAVLNVVTRPIQAINMACLRGGYDVAAVSSAAYPLLAEDYVILDAGASVGRGYGPALVARESVNAATLADYPVAIPGELTTGAMLLRLFYPEVHTIEMPCQAIAPALVRGDIKAGVLIHENLLNWESLGLRRIACRGALWQKRTGLPIPVGLNVARRRLGAVRLRQINRALREAMLLALATRSAAETDAMRYTQQAQPGIGEHYIDMFANEDTLHLAPECRRALELLYRMAADRRLIERRPTLEIIENDAMLALPLAGECA